MISTDIIISATIPPAKRLLPHVFSYTPLTARHLLLRESLHPSAVDNLHIRALLGSVHGSEQPSRLEVYN
jgi:hypothetical protein